MEFSSWESEARRKVILSSRVEASRALREAIDRSRSPPDAFVVMNGIGAYPTAPAMPDAQANQLQPPSTEDSPYANDPLADLVREIEQVSGVYQQPARTRVVSLRSGVILGRDGGTIQNLWPSFYFGFGGPIGNGQQWFPWVWGIAWR